MPLAESATAGSPQLVLYAVRILVGALPWGEGINEVPYRPSELGAVDAAAPAEMVVLEGRQFYMRDPVDGSVCFANPTRGTAQALDLRQVVGDRLGDAFPLAFALAVTPAADVAAVVGARSQSSTQMHYVLCVGLGVGAPRRLLPLDVLSEIPDAPTGLGITSEGDIWILYPQQALLLDNDGRQKKTIAAPGVLLHDEAYLTQERKPRLFAADGREVGTVEVLEADELIPFLAAGPDDVLLAPCLVEEIPDPLEDSLHIVDVYHLDRVQMTIDLHDRIAWPALILQTPLPEGPEDGLPVKSYFPPDSAAFSSGGDLWVLEHTAAQCRFHVFRRLHDASTWARKFVDVRDLTGSELELYRAEAKCRAGLATEAGALAGSYMKMAWMRNDPWPPVSGTDEKLLRSLDHARPGADRK